MGTTADKSLPLLGAHVSIGGGIYNAIANGEKIGANVIQIFSKNQTRWQSKPLSDEEAAKFQSAWQASSIREVVIHDSYLINLGSPEPEMLEKSRQAFLDEIERAAKLGIQRLIFHPGSHLNAGEETGLNTIAASLNRLIEITPQLPVRLLLETTAGQGTNLGYHFEQLALIIDRVENKDRVGVCLDTAHVFAAGYDLRSAAELNHTLAQFDAILGLQNLFAIHINDSKKSLGSRVDRHDHIGAGLLGVETFRLIVNEPRLAQVAKILETPGDEADFARNLALLKSLVV